MTAKEKLLFKLRQYHLNNETNGSKMSRRRINIRKEYEEDEDEEIAEEESHPRDGKTRLGIYDIATEEEQWHQQQNPSTTADRVRAEHQSNRKMNY